MELKILLVIDQFFAANNGMTISSRRFAEKLMEHGNDVRVVSTGKEGDTEYLMKKKYIPVFDKLVTEQGMTFAKTNEELLREAIEWADVVHFLVPFALSHNGMKICEELHKPFTAAFHVQPENITSSIHMGGVKPINNGIYKWFNHYLYQYCTHIHCPSNFIANELRKHGYTGKLHVISNGIDPDFQYRKTAKPEQYKDRILILSIGRLSVEKRQDIIIRAAHKSKYKDKITVMLAGQGPRREKLEELARLLEVNLVIDFYPKDKLIDLISYCDLYVHAASAEIEAMSCMEAFAGGLVPVISNSPKSATPQFALDDRSLFRVGSPNDLALKMDYWLEHPEERKKSELLYAESAKKYNLDECVRQVEEMFAEAIEENKTKVYET